MIEYDYIIAGGGAAGLSLAYQLVQSSLRDRRILIIDRDEKEKTTAPGVFGPLAQPITIRYIIVRGRKSVFYRMISSAPMILANIHTTC